MTPDRLRPSTRVGYAAVCSLFVAGCYERQSVIHPAGPQAARIDALWWLMLAVSVAVYLVVLAFLFHALFRRRREEDPTREAGVQRTLTVAVSIATALTVFTLLAFLVADLMTGRALAAAPAQHPLTIDVTAYQWWWKITYPDTQPSRSVQTANEIHVPTGRPVLIRGSAPDVIHSFWVPNLQGKKDLIPGKKTTTWFQADTPGVYRGQCAEYCGLQHAKMALFVIAEPPAEFAAWLDQQREKAPEPSDPITRKGRDVFLAGSCSMCHNITGTMATGQVAPDLTHLASRMTIAAGTLPNNRGNLAGWILDPQSIKPGSKMPSNALEPADLQALLAYLETLR